MLCIPYSSDSPTCFFFRMCGYYVITYFIPAIKARDENLWDVIDGVVNMRADSINSVHVSLDIGRLTQASEKGSKSRGKSTNYAQPRWL